MSTDGGSSSAKQCEQCGDVLVAGRCLVCRAADLRKRGELLAQLQRRIADELRAIEAKRAEHSASK